MKPPHIVINGKTLTDAQAAAVTMCVVEAHSGIAQLQQTKAADEWMEHLTEVVLILRVAQ